MSVEEIHISYSVNLIFNEYYFKQYINVNAITDGDRHAVTQKTFFESAKISGVGRVTVNQQLFNYGLTKIVIGIYF